MNIDELFILVGIKGDGSLKKTESSLERIKGLATTLGVAFGAGILFRGVNRFIDEQRKLGDELEKTSQALGSSIEDLQSIRFASSIAGVGTAELNTGLRTLQKQARDAALGSQTAVLAFSRLGVSVRDSSGQFKSATQLYRESIGGLAQLRSSTERSAVAQQLFGESGARIALVAKDGVKGFRALEKEAARLGGGFRQKATQAAEEYTDTLVRLNLAHTSLNGVLVEKLLPTVDSFVSWIVDVTVVVRRWVDQTHLLEVALILVGALMVKLLIPFAPAILTILLVTAAIAALIVVIDDLIGTAEGKRSALLRLFDLITKFISKTDVDYSDHLLIAFFERLGVAILGVAQALPGIGTLITFGRLAGSLITPTSASVLPATTTAGGSGGTSVQVENTINVEGVTDPEAVGSIVIQRLQDLNANNMNVALNSLVPSAGL